MARLFILVAALSAFVAVSATRGRQTKEIVLIPRRDLPKNLAKNDDRVEIIINDCWDYVVAELNGVMPDIDYEIDGGTFTFTEEIFGWDIDGSIYLTNGHIGGLNSFYRVGDALAYVDLGSVDVRVGLGLDALSGGFDAGIDFNGLDWSVHPSFNLNAGLRIGVMIGAAGITLSEFSITFEDWDFSIPGLDIIADLEQTLIDWILSLLGDSLSGLFEDTFIGSLLDTIEQIVGGNFDVCAALIPSKLRNPVTPSKKFFPFVGRF